RNEKSVAVPGMVKSPDRQQFQCRVPLNSEELAPIPISCLTCRDSTSVTRRNRHQYTLVLWLKPLSAFPIHTVNAQQPFLHLFLPSLQSSPERMLPSWLSE